MQGIKINHNMKYLTVLLFMLTACNSIPDKTIGNDAYKKVHEQALFIDTHNDILLQVMDKGYEFDDDLKEKTHSDLSRMKEGGLDVQFFSVWSDGSRKNPYAYANKQIDSLDAVINRNPDKIVKTANADEILQTVKQGKIAALIGLEGGHQIENSIPNLNTLYNRGVRYMTLTWNNSTDWATSVSDEKDNPDYKGKGLSDFGKELVKEMNDIGMLVDVSHIGEQTFKDVINTTTKPIIASHSSVYNLCPHKRNLKDYQIKAIAKNNGVIMINFNSAFIDPTAEKKEAAFVKKHQMEMKPLIDSGMDPYYAEEAMYKKYFQEAYAIRAPFDLVIDHIEYVINLVGVDYVGIGSDFDGILQPPQQLADVTAYPLITKALLEKGYKQNDINKILGGNILRVLKANE